MYRLIIVLIVGLFTVDVVRGGDVVSPLVSTTGTLVPRLQILSTAKAEHEEPGFGTPRVIDTFPKGTIQPARKVVVQGVTYWVFPIYRFGLDTLAPRTRELAFRMDESNTVVGVGVLGAQDKMVYETPETLACVLSATEGVYCVEDKRSAHDMQANYWPVGTLLAWKFLIFWEEA